MSKQKQKWARKKSQYREKIKLGDFRQNTGKKKPNYLLGSKQNFTSYFCFEAKIASGYEKMNDFIILKVFLTFPTYFYKFGIVLTI